MSLPRPNPPPGGRVVLVSVSLAVISLIFAWVHMATISRTDPWYRNTDMNSHNLVDALAINSNVLPKPFDQPAVPLKYLLALDYRIRHELGALPVWNLKKFGASADPLRQIPPLIRLERVHSRILVILFILAAAWLTYWVTRRVEFAGLSAILLCGNAGLLFHGLLSRPELLCVGFGNVLALLCTWRALTARSWLGNHAWLFLAGIFVGLSTLEKLPGVCYLGLCFGWCCLAALLPSSEPQPDRARLSFWAGMLPAAGGFTALGVLFLLGQQHEALGPVVLLRLRVAAVGVGVVPLLSLWPWRHRIPLFLLDRMRELALLGGGFLAALLLSYLLLRGVMTESNATSYFAGVLRFVIHPAPYMKELLDAKPATAGFMPFIKQSPFLFISVTALAIGIGWVRAIPLRLKAFIALLWVGAMGMVFVMSRRHYAAQYNIFPQVPLLLAGSLCLYGIETWWQKKARAPGSRWLVPALVAAAFVLMLSVNSRLQPVYATYQNDVELPVNDLTLTYLFDHDDHTDAYVQIMKSHYGDRAQFAATLERYLADPANRY